MKAFNIDGHGVFGTIAIIAGILAIAFLCVCGATNIIDNTFGKGTIKKIAEKAEKMEQSLEIEKTPYIGLTAWQEVDIGNYTFKYKKIKLEGHQYIVTRAPYVCSLEHDQKCWCMRYYRCKCSQEEEDEQ